MCDAVMCEDIAGYYEPGPLYFITSQQSSLAFLQHSSQGQPDQPHSLLPTQGAFIVQFAFFLFYVLPLRNRFSWLIVVQRQFVLGRDARCRVIAVMSLSMQSCCGAGPGSSFTIHNMCKPVHGKALVTCCKITGIDLINESLQLSPLRLPSKQMCHGI